MSASLSGHTVVALRRVWACAVKARWRPRHLRRSAAMAQFPARIALGEQLAQCEGAGQGGQTDSQRPKCRGPETGASQRGEKCGGDRECEHRGDQGVPRPPPGRDEERRQHRSQRSDQKGRRPGAQGRAPCGAQGGHLLDAVLKL